MTDTKHSADLPPLPDAFFAGLMRGGILSQDGYTADQMHAYARAAIAAAAPAGEPVAHVVDFDRDQNESIINTALPAGTPLYAAPVPAALADAEQIKITKADAAMLIDLMDNPLQPNAKLLEAWAKHAKPTGTTAAAPKALAVKNETGLPLVINMSGVEGNGVSTITVRMAPDAAPKAALTDAELDPLIEKVLRAGGSSLRHYSMQKSKDDMRAAMRECLAASGPNAALVAALKGMVAAYESEEMCDPDAYVAAQRALAAAGGI